nr:hypothetical protein [Desulfobacter hydrogenophilus]
MHAEKKSLTEILEKLAYVFQYQTPFNKFLGMRIERIARDNVVVAFDMKPELVGNYAHNVLHGGVISSVLDTTGGIMAAIGIVEKAHKKPIEDIPPRILEERDHRLASRLFAAGFGRVFLCQRQDHSVWQEGYRRAHGTAQQWV